MSRAYGEDYFSVSVFLVLFSRVFGFVFALVMVVVMKESFVCQARLWEYALISLSTVIASVCQYEALKYISFTMQILGKSFKMVPVMIWGVGCFRKHYRLLDWIVSIGVTIGVVWFMSSGDISPEHSEGSSWWGILLLVAFIVLDSFTSTFQEKLFAKSGTSKYNQMLYINLSSALLSLLTLFISGQTKAAFDFCYHHPVVYGDASIMSGSAVVAQWFVYSQVQEFGALAFAATMNLRQIASVLASYIVYAHAITPLQITGLAIVFFSLGYQSLAGLFYDPGERRSILQSADQEAAEYSSSSIIKLKKAALAQCCVPCGGRSSL